MEIQVPAHSWESLKSLAPVTVTQQKPHKLMLTSQVQPREAPILISGATCACTSSILMCRGLCEGQSQIILSYKWT